MFASSVPDYGKGLPFLKIPRFGPLVLLVKLSSRCISMEHTGMIITGGTEVFEGQLLRAPICPPQISQIVTRIITEYPW